MVSHEHQRHSSGEASTSQRTQPNIDSIWKACAYDDLDMVGKFVESDPSCVNRPDDDGYSALQWAALNNRVGVITYLLEHGADVNRADPGGQTALHWAAVRGSISASEMLMRGGADPRLPDLKQYTVMHVAAQYGQTVFLYHMALKWGVDIDLPDAEGRTPLHWAAYKGFTDTLRLLLVMDARTSLTDAEGCTPLHWAAIRGQSEAATVLLQAGSVSLLTMKDETGCTPAALAHQKNHLFLARHMENTLRRHEEQLRSLGKRFPRLGFLLNTQLCPAIWALIIGLLALFFGQAVYNPTFPPLTTGTMLGAYGALATASVGLYLLYRVTTSDPGVLPRGGCLTERGKADRDPERGREGGGHYSQLDAPALWAGNWSQLCVTCRIVRPLRAKHCAVTDRCIETFDHFCPWVGNCIGKGNRHLFLAFLWCELGAIVLSGVVAAVRVHQAAAQRTDPAIHWAVLFIILDLFVGLSVAALACTQLNQVARNVTTNELTNWPRYKYLRAPDGSFHNPFDRGCRANCVEVCAPALSPPSPSVLPTDACEKMSLLHMELGQLNGSHQA